MSTYNHIDPMHNLENSVHHCTFGCCDSKIQKNSGFLPFYNNSFFLSFVMPDEPLLRVNLYDSCLCGCEKL